MSSHSGLCLYFPNYAIVINIVCIINVMLFWVIFGSQNTVCIWIILEIESHVMRILWNTSPFTRSIKVVVKLIIVNIMTLELSKQDNKERRRRKDKKLLWSCTSWPISCRSDMTKSHSYNIPPVKSLRKYLHTQQKVVRRRGKLCAVFPSELTKSNIFALLPHPKPRSISR